MGIKNRKPSQGSKVKVKQDVVEIKKIDYPVFCFRHLHKDYNLDHCTNDEKRSLIEQIAKISLLDWGTIQLSNRHGIGTEKISTSSIKANIPYELTEDVEYLLAFRFDGMKPFIGHRDKFIFHVLFIDRDFTLYKHS